MQRPDRSKEWIAPETKYLPFPCKLNPAWAVLPFTVLGPWASSSTTASALSIMHISDMEEISVVPPHRAPSCRKCAWWTGGTHWGWSLTDPFFFWKFHKVRHLTEQHARDKVSARLFDGLKSNTFYAFCTGSVTQLRLSSGKRTSLGTAWAWRRSSFIMNPCK